MKECREMLGLWNKERRVYWSLTATLPNNIEHTIFAALTAPPGREFRDATPRTKRKSRPKRAPPKGSSLRTVATSSRKRRRGASSSSRGVYVDSRDRVLVVYLRYVKRSEFGLLIISASLLLFYLDVQELTILHDAIFFSTK
jgi:hypothetical protein